MSSPPLYTIHYYCRSKDGFLVELEDDAVGLLIPSDVEIDKERRMIPLGVKVTSHRASANLIGHRFHICDSDGRVRGSLSTGDDIVWFTDTCNNKVAEFLLNEPYIFSFALATATNIDGISINYAPEQTDMMIRQVAPTEVR
jgi:hypothetical protein